MEKATTLEHVALQPGGGVTIRLQKRVMDGDSIFSSEPHMLTLTDDQAMEDGLADLDAYLALNKWPKISADDRKFILGQAGSDAVVQARAHASDFAQEVRARADGEAQAAIALVRQEAAAQVAGAVSRAEAAEGKVATLETALAAAEARAEALTSSAATAAEARESLEARLQKVEAAVASAAEPAP